MADGTNHGNLRFGSLFTGTPTYDAEVRKRTEAFGILDRICEALEPTDTQMGRAKTSYEAVSAWLADDPALAGALIYAQGSASHGTMVRPIDRNEHDVDLICHISRYGPSLAPSVLKQLVGNRLRAHGVYADILEEMPRCWRLNYAGEFHLDITPSIPNPACSQGGELVPDRKLQAWKASNPAGFRDLFARRAALQPLMRALAKTVDARAEVQPFPVSSRAKGILRRIVQLLKRHRDLEFRSRDGSLAPLSIIITTLGSKAYEFCVKNYPYDNELDLMCDTIRAMPWFIEELLREWGTEYVVPNETTKGENFAEKWRTEPARRVAFNAWQAKALADFEDLKALDGLDAIHRRLSPALGDEPVRKALGSLTNQVGAARTTGSLLIRPKVGLAAGAAASAAATPVPSNTFFGRG